MMLAADDDDDEDDVDGDLEEDERPHSFVKDVLLPCDVISWYVRTYISHKCIIEEVCFLSCLLFNIFVRFLDS